MMHILARSCSCFRRIFDHPLPMETVSGQSDQSTDGWRALAPLPRRSGIDRRVHRFRSEPSVPPDPRCGEPPFRPRLHSTEQKATQKAAPPPLVWGGCATVGEPAQRSGRL